MQQDITVLGSLLSAVAVLLSGVLFWGANARIPLSYLTWGGDSPPEKRFRRKRLTYALAAWLAVALAVVSSSTVLLDRYYGPLFDRSALAWLFDRAATDLVSPSPAQSAPSAIDPITATGALTSASCQPRVALDWPPMNFCRPDRSIRQCRFRLDAAAESDEASMSRSSGREPISARRLVRRLASDRHMRSKLVLSSETVCSGAS